MSGPNAEKGAGRVEGAWIYGPEAACRFIAATAWPWEREENRDAWAVTMLDRPALLASEIDGARARLEAAVACVIPPAETDAPDDDPVTWVMPREDARDLLRWLRHNRPLGMPDRTFDGLVDALVDTRPLPPGSGDTP